LNRGNCNRARVIGRGPELDFLAAGRFQQTGYSMVAGVPLQLLTQADKSRLWHDFDFPTLTIMHRV
jgi:hypothetical protein